MKEKRGITLVTIVITIIVLLIIAGVTTALIPNDANKLFDSAEYSDFIVQFSKVQQEVNLKRIEILDNNNNETIANLERDYFKEVTIVTDENLPNEFIDTNPNQPGIQGKLVMVSKLPLEDVKYGRGNVENATSVQFGSSSSDFFILDANQRVFYIKGYTVSGETKYSLIEKQISEEITLRGPDRIFNKTGDVITYTISTTNYLSLANVRNNVSMVGTATTGATMAITNDGKVFTIKITVGTGNGTIGIKINSNLLEEGTQDILSETAVVDNLGPTFQIEVR